MALKNNIREKYKELVEKITGFPLPHLLKCIYINDFFNQNIDYQPDVVTYFKKDYWATLDETLKRGFGDCEDYAIAKYFTCLQNGAPSSFVGLGYATWFNYQKPVKHMVTVFHSQNLLENNELWILDNIEETIYSLTQRPELRIHFYFNNTDVYKIEDGKIKVIGNSRRLRLWDDLLNRMNI